MSSNSECSSYLSLPILSPENGEDDCTKVEWIDYLLQLKAKQESKPRSIRSTRSSLVCCETIQSIQLDEAIATFFNCTKNNINVSMNDMDVFIIERMHINLNDLKRTNATLDELFHAIVTRQVTVQAVKYKCTTLYNKMDIFQTYNIDTSVLNNIECENSMWMRQRKLFGKYLQILFKQISSSSSLLRNHIEQLGGKKLNQIWPILKTCNDINPVIASRQEFFEMYENLLLDICTRNDGILKAVTPIYLHKTSIDEIGLLTKITGEAGSLLHPKCLSNQTIVLAGVNYSQFIIGNEEKIDPFQVVTNFNALIHILYGGAPRLWLIVKRAHVQRLTNLFGELFKSHQSPNDDTISINCPVPLSHGRFIILPSWLEDNGIKYDIFVQHPGTCVLLRENVYFQTIDLGVNLSESIHFSGVLDQLLESFKINCQCNYTDSVIAPVEVEKMYTNFRIVKSNSRQLKCSLCPKINEKYFNPAELRYHFVVHHLTQEKVYRCRETATGPGAENCKFETSSMLEFRKHVRAKHREKQFCYLCRYRSNGMYLGIESLRRHLIVYHQLHVPLKIFNDDIWQREFKETFYNKDIVPQDWKRHMGEMMQRVVEEIQQREESLRIRNEVTNQMYSCHFCDGCEDTFKSVHLLVHLERKHGLSINPKIFYTQQWFEMYHKRFSNRQAANMSAAEIEREVWIITQSIANANNNNNDEDNIFYDKGSGALNIKKTMQRRMETEILNEASRKAQVVFNNEEIDFETEEEETIIKSKQPIRNRKDVRCAGIKQKKVHQILDIYRTLCPTCKKKIKNSTYKNHFKICKGVPCQKCGTKFISNHLRNRHFITCKNKNKRVINTP